MRRPLAVRPPSPRARGHGPTPGRPGPALPRVPPRIHRCPGRPRTRERHRNVGREATGTRGHDPDPVRQPHGLADRMGDQDDRAPSGHPECLELSVEGIAGQRVEGAERLVEKEDRRVGNERPGQGDPLLHPARELPRARDGGIGQANLRHCPIGGCSAFGCRDPGELQRERDVVGGRSPGQEARLLEHDSHPTITGARRDLVGAQTDVTRGRRQQSCQHPQQGGLAASIGTDDRDQLLGCHRTAQPTQCRHRLPAREEGDGQVGDRDRGGLGCFGVQGAPDVVASGRAARASCRTPEPGRRAAPIGSRVVGGTPRARLLPSGL